ncbi:MAG: glycosyl hydrolase family 8 [Planctomycetaceae bacterium]
MKAKKILLGLALLLAGGTAHAQPAKDWQDYRKHFVSSDGRVVDFLQGKISHSEGQGYGLLLAVLQDDPKTFSLLWNWTRDNLRMRKGDSLLSWKWGQRPNGQWAVLDYNNATDGDILIAWALLKGAKKWKNEDYRGQAREIVKAVRENLVIQRRGKLQVLPGYYGFVLKEGEVLNPSYLIFPAFREFAELEEPQFWKKVYEDSLEILKKSAFGRLRLPADWILVKESGISIYQERSRFFGYEAVRTLLYLAWDGSLGTLPGAKALLDMYSRLGYVPLNVDLVMNNISLEEAPGGYYAIYGRTARDLGEAELGRSLLQRAAKKVQAEKDDYYSHTLYLLSLAEGRQ